jgi:hypothetical protein
MRRILHPSQQFSVELTSFFQNVKVEPTNFPCYENPVQVIYISLLITNIHLNAKHFLTFHFLYLPKVAFDFVASNDN